MHKRSLILILALAAVLPSSAATFVSGTWYHVITNDSANATNGASGSSGVDTYVDPGPTPWSFSLLSAGTLEFVDAQFPGDTIQVMNGASSLGVTPQGSIFNPTVNCGFSPTDCLANPDFVRITINLVANTVYSLQFIALDSPLQTSSGFFRITGTFAAEQNPDPDPEPQPGAVPEPATYALTGAALAVVGYLKARKR